MKHVMLRLPLYLAEILGGKEIGEEPHRKMFRESSEEPTLHPGLRLEEVAPTVQTSNYYTTGNAGILAGSDGGDPSIFKLILNSDFLIWYLLNRR